MLYNKKNYLFFLLSVAFIIIGFALMAGGKPSDPQAFSDAIFSVRRIVIAPIICLTGFVLVIYAILAKPGTPDNTGTKK